MYNNTHFTTSATVFHEELVPYGGFIVGYAAIVEKLGLPVPITFPVSMISKQNKSESGDKWKLFPNKYLPDDHTGESEIYALYKHLVFALKYEGVNLLIFSYLANKYDDDQLSELVSIEPLGQYSRRIWFLIEWVTNRQLNLKNLKARKQYVNVLDEKLQYGIKGVKSPRHLVINNLPGNPLFCPLIRKTQKLEQFISSRISEQKTEFPDEIRRDIMLRASAYLLLKDSKASFSIEDENPKTNRILRWSQAIGQAGTYQLSKQELLRLQQIVIENGRFIHMGIRHSGGFVGVHDRISGDPIPDHISAKWQDLDDLLDGVVKTADMLINSEFDPVLTATVISFGFVFIHPFEDGNGRIHRYLIHDVLAKRRFSQQGITFPISTAILNNIAEYRKVLETYSKPLLNLIHWKVTKDHNIEVINDTKNYYSFFDATPQAEFLYDCVSDTVNEIIPAEIDYLVRFDEFRQFLDNEYEMPDKTVHLLIRFLSQNNGRFSRRAREKEFAALLESEVENIERKYREIFQSTEKLNNHPGQDYP